MSRIGNNYTQTRDAEMLGLSLKAKIFGLGLEAHGLGLAARGLELETKALLYRLSSTVVYKFSTEDNRPKPLYNGSYARK